MFLLTAMDTIPLILSTIFSPVLADLRDPSTHSSTTASIIIISVTLVILLIPCVIGSIRIRRQFALLDQEADLEDKNSLMQTSAKRSTLPMPGQENRELDINRNKLLQSWMTIMNARLEAAAVTDKAV